MSNLWNQGRANINPSVVLEGETIPALFWNAVARRGEQVWLRQKKLGIWRSWSWNQAAQAVREIAAGLVSLGFAPGDRASILSNTVIEWVLADMAIMSSGGVANGIYPTDAAHQVQYLCEDSHTTFLFVEGDEQLDKVLGVRPQLPALRKIIVFDMKGLRDLTDPGVISLRQLREFGREWLAKYPSAVDERARSCQSGDLAILVYTSGTTGKPKGGMHSHAGIVHTVRGYNTVLGQDERDERICFLPLCHIAERVGGEYFALYTGSILNFVENPETVPENVREISPTIFAAVPRVWEKFYSIVMLGLKEASALQRAVYEWSIGVGAAIADRVMAGQAVGVGLRVKFYLARWLALNNVRKLIGVHRARYLITGAAPISPELVKWYLALGIPMFEIWGMTETCGGATGVRAGLIKPGSVGPAARFNEIRIDPSTSEILVRGANVFMGYLNQPEKSTKAIDRDGWLRTGDMGNMDQDGYLHITDRLTEVITTARGKNITPSELENELKISAYITDAVVTGDRRPYLSAIIMIDQENVEKFAQESDVPFSNYASLTRAAQVQALIRAEIDRVNTKFANAEQIRKFHLLETQLNAEDEELTPTMKLKRHLVKKKYALQIEAMYA